MVTGESGARQAAPIVFHKTLEAFPLFLELFPVHIHELCVPPRAVQWHLD